MKILWVGDAVEPSGFSVVTHNICNSLNEYCDVVVYGINYDGKMLHDYDYKIYPAKTGSDIYSFNRLSAVLALEKPDIVVLFNDDHIICNYLASASGSSNKIIPMFPVNILPIDVGNILHMSLPDFKISKGISYTKYASKLLASVNPNIDFTPVYHGVDREKFFKAEVKSSLGLGSTFVVGWVGSNTLRKRPDLFLKGFAEFCKDKQDTKCLIHSGQSGTYDILGIAKRLGIVDKIILSSNEKTEEEMNFMYNLMDVNVNTSLGEGFGLPLLEGAACGVPILCPDDGNLKDIWGDSAKYLSIAYEEDVPNTKFLGKVIDHNDLAKQLNTMYENTDITRDLADKVHVRANSPMFDWSTVTKKIYDVIRDVNKNRNQVIS